MIGVSKPLPANWKWATLGELVTFESGRYIPASDVSKQGPIPVYGANGIIGFTDKACFREPRIIVGRVGSYGAINLTSGESWITDNTIVCLPGALVDFQYLAMYLRIADFDALRSVSIQPLITQAKLRTLQIPVAPIEEQRTIAALLINQIRSAERARAAVEAQLQSLEQLIEACIRESLDERAGKLPLADFLEEITTGVGPNWGNYPVIGATRDGLAPGKEKVGKNPGRYKLVEPGMVFYNPMRILIGSVAMVDDNDASGITSPDYVVVKAKPSRIHHRWFYYWFRSSYGQAFIKTLARGAVRERIMFQRLKAGIISVPSMSIQVETANRLRAVAALRSTLEDQLQAVIALPESLMNRAFQREL